jgi:hypothetical protein
MEVSYLYAPMYESITMAKILAEASKYPDVMSVLPDEPDWPRMQRQWLINVCFTRLEGLFAKWIDERVEERNRCRATENNLMLTLDPEIAKAFARSTHVSTRYVQLPRSFLFLCA